MAAPACGRPATEAPATDHLPWIVLGLACGNILLNAVFPPGSILLGGVITAVLIWTARVDLLPAVLVAQLTKADFVLSGYGDMSYFINKYEQSAIAIAGFPVSVNYFLAATVVARITWEWLERPSTFAARPIARLVAGSWTVAMILALVTSLLGWQERNPSWTLPLRTVMLGGSILYGLIVAGSWEKHGRRALDIFLVVGGFLLNAAVAGRFFSLLLWWLVPLLIPLGVSRLVGRGLFWRLVGAEAALAALAYGLGLSRSDFRVTEDAGGLTGTGNSTFTLNSLMALSVGLTVLSWLPVPRMRQMAGVFLGWPSFVLVVACTFAVIAFAPEKGGGGAKWAADPASMTPMERLEAKVFEDRGVIWAAAWDTVREPPYVLKPSGRPILVNTRIGISAWTAGAHNSVLELLRLGWVVGVIVLLWVWLGLAQAGQAYGISSDRQLHAICIAVICTGTVGAFTGHYPVSDIVVFWFMSAAGLVWGLAPGARTDMRRRVGVRILQGRSWNGRHA